ncbi:unnamed protein product [Laminaria digitata]
MPHATVHGTDLSPDMVEQIRKRGAEAGASNLQASVADGELLSGFDDEPVDAAVCAGELESMINYAQAIRHFHRVLKPNGVAVLAVCDKDPNSMTVRVFGVVSTLQGDAAETGPEVSHMQALGGNEGVTAMKGAGFEDIEVTRHSVPFYVNPTFGYRELFACMATCTPIHAALAVMEKRGRPNTREEACALFESQMLEDMEQGRAPTGPGLPSAKHATAGDGLEPAVEGSPNPSAKAAFYVPSVLIQGRKSG